MRSRHFAEFITRLLFLLVPLCPVAFCTTNLYVQTITTQSGAARIRTDLEQELRKDKDVKLIDNEANADATLDGAGEIWVRGYQSLNPRSGRSAENGNPIYDGYLAVELKDKKGQTFWSYLVTPSSSTFDVSKDLAKQIARRVSVALAHGEPTAFTTTQSKPSAVLKAAGATFPEPVYMKWFTNYRLANPNLEITYQSVGSEAGVSMLLAGTVDFGASDNPAVIRDLAPNQLNSYVLLPTVVGAVVPIVNLPGVSQALNLTPDVLARIFLGDIKKWDDPLIRKSNRGVNLPALDIKVVHRADGSGTSYAFSEFLSATCPEWKSRVGVSMQPNWPVGKESNGNEGVAETVREFGGSIGYVEFIYALQNHLKFARVQNREGEFVAAGLESMAHAAATAVLSSENLQLSIVNAPGQGSYPIASFTWLVIPSEMTDSSKLEGIKGFLRWMLGPGQLQAAALGYLALPQQVIAREQIVINQLR